MTNRSLVGKTLLASAFFSIAILSSGTVSAGPKAAEHEDAPVTYGADAVKPKPAAKVNKTPSTAKPKSAAKTKSAPNTPQTKKKPHKASGK